MTLSTIAEAIEDLKEGKFLIIVDDEDRENEGDLAIAATKVTPAAINFMAMHGRGLICLPIVGQRLDELGIPMMVGQNTSRFTTAFTVSVEAKHKVSTGISAAAVPRLSDFTDPCSNRARSLPGICSPEG
jgi:3,4-dihydroxy 2-butanone 4-phosphate synthase/GTP cyclohydrolase II